MKIIYPDYENCLTNLTNSILKYFDITPYHTTLKKLDKILEEDNYDNVVLLIYDGMGSNILNRNLDEKSFLRTNKFLMIYLLHYTMQQSFPYYLLLQNYYPIYS